MTAGKLSELFWLNPLKQLSQVWVELSNPNAQSGSCEKTKCEFCPFPHRTCILRSRNTQHFCEPGRRDDTDNTLTSTVSSMSTPFVPLNQTALDEEVDTEDDEWLASSRTRQVCHCTTCFEVVIFNLLYCTLVSHLIRDSARKAHSIYNRMDIRTRLFRIRHILRHQEYGWGYYN